MNYIWKTQLGFFSTEAMDFVANPEEYTPLYMDTSDKDNLILADSAFLRRTLLFYGFPIADCLKTVEEKQEDFTSAIQDYLDNFAQTRNYDGIMSAATYATSTVPKFHTEGQYAVEARDATWNKAYAILDEVLSGKRPMPTIEEIIAELPPLAWPEVSA